MRDENRSALPRRATPGGNKLALSPLPNGPRLKVPSMVNCGGASMNLHSCGAPHKCTYCLHKLEAEHDCQRTVYPYLKRKRTDDEHSFCCVDDSDIGKPAEQAKLSADNVVQSLEAQLPVLTVPLVAEPTPLVVPPAPPDPVSVPIPAAAPVPDPVPPPAPVPVSEVPKPTKVRLLSEEARMKLWENVGSKLCNRYHVFIYNTSDLMPSTTAADDFM